MALRQILELIALVIIVFFIIFGLVTATHEKEDIKSTNRRVDKLLDDEKKSKTFKDLYS